MARLLEPSTWAGLGVACHAVSLILADKGNGAAWGELVGAVAAVVLREKAA